MSEEEKEFKADHFENIEELVKTCKMWVTDDDYDAYCRFFDMGAMEEILNLISNLQKELDKSNKRINMCIDLLNGEGCLNYDTYEEKIKYIDKLIELENKE